MKWSKQLIRMTMAIVRQKLDGASFLIAFLMLTEAMMRKIKSVPSKKARMKLKKIDLSFDSAHLLVFLCILKSTIISVKTNDSRMRGTREPMLIRM